MKNAIARSGSGDVTAGPIGDRGVVEDGGACEMGVRQVFVACTGNFESGVGVEGGIGIGGRVSSADDPAAGPINRTIGVDRERSVTIAQGSATPSEERINGEGIGSTTRANQGAAGESEILEGNVDIEDA